MLRCWATPIEQPRQGIELRGCRIAFAHEVRSITARPWNVWRVPWLDTCGGTFAQDIDYSSVELLHSLPSCLTSLGSRLRPHPGRPILSRQPQTCSPGLAAHLALIAQVAAPVRMQESHTDFETMRPIMQL